jgi:hypothetical protein
VDAPAPDNPAAIAPAPRMKARRDLSIARFGSGSFRSDGPAASLEREITIHFSKLHLTKTGFHFSRSC